MNNLGIKKTRISGYRPQTNGQTKQSNNTVKIYLTSFLEHLTEKNSWDLM